VEEHVLIRLLVRCGFVITRSTTFNLDTAASFMLNMFNISATMAYNLCTKVKAWSGFQIYGNLFFQPFALKTP
jgi:hypothetical protein